MKKILVTGAAGFIGYYVSKKLLVSGFEVTGIDNINDYYDTTLKHDRVKHLINDKQFSFHTLDIIDKDALLLIFKKERFDGVINLAAQPGVRYSLINPHAYIDSNIVGFINILEGCRQNNVQHLVYASSSSVYGKNTKIPFSEHHNVDHPASLYAATKKANELMAHTYSGIYNIPCTGLRFFTVYGPWGRPDMAYFLFTKAIIEGKPINIFNHGEMKRDFTYIDDIVEGVVKVMMRIPCKNPDWDGESPDPATSNAPYRVYNIGNNKPVELLRFVAILEEYLGKKAVKKMLPMQPGDVPVTYANVDELIKDVGFKPATPIETGLKKFTDWYKWYFNVR